ncbi:kinase-like domain-containing protein [Mycena sp. CBHHK59/15]|nr:kinase-like domain-containing protein [Mycena sp. CBHHK59/15]
MVTVPPKFLSQKHWPSLPLLVEAGLSRCVVYSISATQAKPSRSIDRWPVQGQSERQSLFRPRMLLRISTPFPTLHVPKAQGPHLVPQILFYRQREPAPAEDAEGAVVGGYTLGPIIAHGGFSTIRRASSAATRAVVAVKIVPRAAGAGAGAGASREAAVWAALSHEHVLPLFAAVHTPRADFLVTQLCAASLADVLRAGAPAREDAGRVFRQVVRGLRYLHAEARLVHRDVKLENVLVDEAGACRISDFGMAVRLDEDGLAEEEGDGDGGGAGRSIPSCSTTGRSAMGCPPWMRRCTARCRCSTGGASAT